MRNIYNLAIMHEPDFEQMKPYLEQAANQHHPEALFFLGNLYMGSDVVERDFEMAKVCFELAAMQGHAKAMEELVSLYVEQRLEPSFYNVHRNVSPPTNPASRSSTRSYRCPMQGHANAEELVFLYVEHRLEPSFYYVHRYVSPQPTRLAEAVQDHADAQFHIDPVLNGNIYYYLGT
jgi:TPR repeat protein